MLVKEYVRLDYADGKRKFNVVLDHVNVFAGHWPKGTAKEDASKTVVTMGNGMVMLLDVSVENFRKTLAAYKK